MMKYFCAGLKVMISLLFTSNDFQFLKLLDKIDCVISFVSV